MAGYIFWAQLAQMWFLGPKCQKISSNFIVLLNSSHDSGKNEVQFVNTGTTISEKSFWDSLYFHKTVYKKILDLLKVTQNPPSSLTQCCTKPGRSHARQWRPQMSRHICNQHWIRGEGVRVSQFLSLIVSKIKIFLKRVF